MEISNSPTISNNNNLTETDFCKATKNLIPLEAIMYHLLIPISCAIESVLWGIFIVVLYRLRKVNVAYLYIMYLISIDFITTISQTIGDFSRCSFFTPFCDSTKSLRLFLYFYSTYINFFLLNSFESTSIWITVVLSVERCLAMKSLNRHNRSGISSSNISKTYLVIGIVTFCCILVNLPRLFVMKIATTNNTSINNTSNNWYIIYTEFGESKNYQFYEISMIVMNILVPLLILVIFNVFLILFIRKLAKKRTQLINQKNIRFSQSSSIPWTSSQRFQSAQNNLTTMLVSMISVFVATQVPYVCSNGRVFELINDWLYLGCTKIVDCCLYRRYRAFFAALAYFNHLFKYMMFFFLNTQIKRTTTELFNNLSSIMFPMINQKDSNQTDELRRQETYNEAVYHSNI